MYFLLWRHFQKGELARPMLIEERGLLPFTQTLKSHFIQRPRVEGHLKHTAPLLSSSTESHIPVFSHTWGRAVPNELVYECVLGNQS